jgi:hypothetical protein
MITETYKGRKIRVKKGPEWGSVDATVNGVFAATAGCYGDQAKAVAQIRTQIDHIDLEPVNGERWGAEWYAPGTYELCERASHPMVIGGPCQHQTCRRRAS